MISEAQKAIAPIILTALLAVAGWASVAYISSLTNTPVIEHESKFEPIKLAGRKNAHKVSISVTNLSPTTRIDLLTVIVKSPDPTTSDINFLEDPAPEIAWVAPTSVRNRQPDVLQWEINFHILKFDPQAKVSLIYYYTGNDRPKIARRTTHPIHFWEPNQKTRILKNLSWLYPVIIVLAIFLTGLLLILFFRIKPSRKDEQ